MFRSICFNAIHSPIGNSLISQRFNLDLIVSLNLNTWQNRENIQIIIHDAMH